MEKRIYIEKVKTRLQGMRCLSDIVNYYEGTVQIDNIITTDEFLELCKQVGIK